MAMLLITHDLGIVAQMAHKVALMYAGQIVEVATTDEFFDRPLHPYAQMLFAALPDTAKRGRPLAAIAGTVPRLDREFDGCRFADRCPLVFGDCPAPRRRCTSLTPAIRSAASFTDPLSPRGRGPGRGGGSTGHQVSPSPPAPPPARERGAGRAAARRARLQGLVPDPQGTPEAHRRATSRRSTACRSRSRRPARSPWSANRAAARRPSARESCSCCAASPASKARPRSTASGSTASTARRCAAPAARCRSSSRTRSPR
jgi:oligopeptide/dipeptide ABC transporter ATP-binding protein